MPKQQKEVQAGPGLAAIAKFNEIKIRRNFKLLATTAKSSLAGLQLQQALVTSVNLLRSTSPHLGVQQLTEVLTTSAARCQDHQRQRPLGHFWMK